MYPSPHTVMYASTPALADGGLAVLNAFSQGTSAMQVSHAQAQDTGETRKAEHAPFCSEVMPESFQDPVCVPLPRCCPSGVPHSTSRHGADPRLSGAATPSTARSAFYK